MKQDSSIWEYAIKKLYAPNNQVLGIIPTNDQGLVLYDNGREYLVQHLYVLQDDEFQDETTFTDYLIFRRSKKGSARWVARFALNKECVCTTLGGYYYQDLHVIAVIALNHEDGELADNVPLCLNLTFSRYGKAITLLQDSGFYELCMLEGKQMRAEAHPDVRVGTTKKKKEKVHHGGKNVKIPLKIIEKYDPFGNFDFDYSSNFGHSTSRSDDNDPSGDDSDADDNDKADSGPAKEPPFTSTSPTLKASLGGKRNSALDEFAQGMVAFDNLKVVEGEKLLQYQHDLGYYRQIPQPEQYVSERLETGGFRAQLSPKDVQDIVKKMRWHPSCISEMDQFNRYETLINTRDGVLDFTTGEVQDHSPDFLFTYAVNASYLGPPKLVSCPVFDSFCETSLAPLHRKDAETDRAIIEQKRRLLLEMIGYICCDCNAGKCALFLMGAPDSGKSIINKFIQSLFDPEKALISSIQPHQLSGRFDKAALFGKKLNAAGEIHGKNLRDISIFKSITGGDSIQAEYKGKDPFSFIPRCKLLFAGNVLPTFSESDTTNAFMNRVKLLLFHHSIPKEKQDKDLSDKLFAERDAIFTRAVDALRELKNRNYDFTQPKESAEFLQSFKERGNSLQAFLKDRCVIEPEAQIFNVDLYKAYKQYCQENGFEAFSRAKLYELLSGISGVTMKRIRKDSENRWAHIGIRLKEEASTAGTTGYGP